MLVCILLFISIFLFDLILYVSEQTKKDSFGNLKKEGKTGLQIREHDQKLISIFHKRAVSMKDSFDNQNKCLN